jgi:hypothetical protein
MARSPARPASAAPAYAAGRATTAGGVPPSRRAPPPRVRAGLKLKLRLLAERLRALAERHVRELEEAPHVDIDKLMQALNVLKMARLEAMGRRRRRKWQGTYQGETLTGAQWEARDVAVRRALTEMRRGGVDLDRAPQDALDLLTHAHSAPEDDHPALRPRGARRR